MCCGRIRSISSTPVLRASGGAGVTLAYVGRTALSVTGPASGVIYRFAGPGARLRVDARDAASLLKVSVLRAVG